MLDIIKGRRTQVVKGEVCKTSMQRFESARRLHFSLGLTFLFPPILIYLFIPSIAFQDLEPAESGVRGDFLWDFH